MAKFKPGQSGNPSGRPKLDPELKELARAQTPAAVRTLLEVMKSAKAPAAARVAAAQAILDRGHGKPHQSNSTELTGKDGAPIASSRLDDLDWARRIAWLLHKGEKALDEMGTAKGSDAVN